MAKLWTAIAGVSRSTADRYVELGNAVERGEASRADKAELARLDSTLTAGLKRQIQRGGHSR